MDPVLRTSLYKTCKIWKLCQAWCRAFHCTMDSPDLLTSGTNVSGGRINHQLAYVLGEPSWLLFPKRTRLFQVHTLYFNSFLSVNWNPICQTVWCWSLVRTQKENFKHLSSGTLHLGQKDLLAFPESTPFPAHLFFLIHFSCSSLPGRVLKHFLIGILCIITRKINSDSTTCMVPSLIITAFFLFGIPVVFAVWYLV